MGRSKVRASALESLRIFRRVSPSDGTLEGLLASRKPSVGANTFVNTSAATPHPPRHRSLEWSTTGAIAGRDASPSLETSNVGRTWPGAFHGGWHEPPSLFGQGWCRSGSTSEVAGPQARVLRHIEEQIDDVAPVVQILPPSCAADGRC